MRTIAIAGGGAAGFFAAINAAETNPSARVIIFEKTAQFLTKVKISGGGRCNVTHHCFEPRELARRYPRGERELISPYQQFQAKDTVEWFKKRGVPLKTEPDGRMFPRTDSSQTIIDCLVSEAKKLLVELRPNLSVNTAPRIKDQFELTLSNGEVLIADRLLIAVGGARSPALAQLATSLGHTLVPPVPSLFTFEINQPWLHELSGLTLPMVEASVPAAKLRERGPLLFTHWGLSGPAILRLSAWGARELAALDYKFYVQINWLPDLNENQIREQLTALGRNNPARHVTNLPLPGIPNRLWEKLVLGAGVRPLTRWSALPKDTLHRITQRIQRTELPVTGKSLNKDEFVTCGGIKLSEVDFKTLQSKLVPGLYFAGEILDIDGITGGFNFQAAWTTGYLAGRAMGS